MFDINVMLAFEQLGAFPGREKFKIEKSCLLSQPERGIKEKCQRSYDGEAISLCLKWIS